MDSGSSERWCGIGGRLRNPASTFAVLRAPVWPAFLVYRAFEVLHGMNARGESDNH